MMKEDNLMLKHWLKPQNNEKRLKPQMDKKGLKLQIDKKRLKP